MKPVITLPVQVVIDFVEVHVFDQMPIPVFHRCRMRFRRRITRIAAVCSVSFHDSAVQVDGVHIRVKRKIVDHQQKTDKKNFIDFFNKLKEYPYLKEISKITMDSKDEMKIFLIDGLEISFGKLLKIEDKLNAIDRILLDIKAKNIQAVELILDVGENPIVVTEDN